MELAISIGLGVWVALGALICLLHLRNDNKREEKAKEVLNGENSRGEQE